MAKPPASKTPTSPTTNNILSPQQSQDEFHYREQPLSRKLTIRRQDIPVMIITAVAAVLVYHNSLHGAFVFDDLPAVVDNPDVDASRTSIFTLFKNNFWGQGMDAYDTQHQSYRPLTVLTFRMNHSLHGMTPFGFHIGNVIAHVLVSILFVIATRQILPRSSPVVIAICGLLFATHPIHTEAVSSIVGRAEILSGFFFLLSFLAYIISTSNNSLVHSPGNRSNNVIAGKSGLTTSALGRGVCDKKWMFISLCLAGAAVLCKEQGITVIGLIAVYDFIVLSQLDVPTAWNILMGSRPSKLSTVTSPSSPQASGSLPQKQTSASTAPSSFSAPRTATYAQKQAFLTFIKRQGMMFVGFVAIMYLRLRMNSVDIVVDEKTNPNHIKEFVYRALTKLFYVTFHAWLLVFPRDLNCDWSGGSIDLVRSVTDVRNLGSVLLLSALTWLVYQGFFYRRGCYNKQQSSPPSGTPPECIQAKTEGHESSVRECHARDAVAISVGWLIVSFLPASGLFMEVGFVVAERLLYVPSFAFCLLVTLLLQQIYDWDPSKAMKHTTEDGPQETTERNDEIHQNKNPTITLGKILACLIAMAILSAYSWRTIERNNDWQSELALYSSGVKVAPNNAKLHHNAAYYATGPEKEFHYREAIRLYPPYISAYINLGVLLSQAGRTAEAIEMYKKGIEMHYKYPLYSTNVALLHRNLAAAYLQNNDHINAFQHYNKCLRLEPGHAYCTQMVNQLRQVIATSTWHYQGKVKLLDDESFGRFLKKQKPHVVLFFTHACEDCDRIKESFAQASVTSSLRFGALHCDLAEPVCSSSGVSSYPTLRYYREDGTWMDATAAQISSDSKLLSFLQEAKGVPPNANAAPSTTTKKVQKPKHTEL